jgi:hypothetical protein
MKSSLSLLLSALVLPSMLAAGCGDDDNNKGDMILTGDLAGAKDMSAKACTAVSAWPSDDIDIAYGGPVDADPFDFAIISHAVKTNGSQLDAVSVELWHQATTPAAPRTLMLPANGDYTSCEVCVLLDENYDRDQMFGDVGYFARGGMVTVTKADFGQAMGMVNVSGSNINLVEWDFNNDKPVTNGKCFDVASFSISGSFSAPDGGTD